jgi:hypothetical protein
MNRECLLDCEQISVLESCGAIPPLHGYFDHSLFPEALALLLGECGALVSYRVMKHVDTELRERCSLTSLSHALLLPYPSAEAALLSSPVAAAPAPATARTSAAAACGPTRQRQQHAEDHAQQLPTPSHPRTRHHLSPRFDDVDETFAGFDLLNRSARCSAMEAPTFGCTSDDRDFPASFCAIAFRIFSPVL